MAIESIHLWLTSFSLEPDLHAHTVAVIVALPDAVRGDLMEDPSFLMCDVDYGSGAAVSIPVAAPGLGAASRSVVLKRSLRRRSESFVRYVIAHELAHAFLRNAGRHENEDPEHAADALAAEWGFPRPAGF